jgi:hypothetical protein
MLQMKALNDRTSNLQSQSIAAGVAARVAEIFEKYPVLCGFTVRRPKICARFRESRSRLVLTGPGVSAELYGQPV